ncbi:hypothetical protein [Frankia sp. EAN1pec]|uniref:hypothetical protein n=1 Tax=Parafrankia sp. (strain EAN1pec) TaxID=298653 RepID=UPI0006747023
MPWTVGPGSTIAQDARDAVTVLSVIAGPDGRDHLGIGFELTDPRGEIDLGADGLRPAWTDDFGFARPYCVEENSPRVIANIRAAAFSLSGIGAEVEETGERREDYLSALATHRSVFSDMPTLGPEAAEKPPPRTRGMPSRICASAPE